MTIHPAHRRRSIRLKGYDYTQAGAYFITICTHNREQPFGEIVDGEMQLNELGQIVQSTWHDLVNHVDGIALGEFVIMPNHIHGIITIVGAGSEPAPTEPTLPAPMGPALTKPTLPAFTGTPTGIAPMGIDPTVGAGSEPAPTEPTLTASMGPALTQPNLPAFTGTLTGIAPMGIVPTVGAGSEPAPTIPAPTITTPTITAPTNTAPKQTPLSEIVRQLKTFSARRINLARNTPGNPVWQRNYYEHIIRDEKSYLEIAQYILDNPAKWELDSLYPGGTA